MVTSYEVMWRALSSGDDEDSGTIVVVLPPPQELESNTVYSVIVAVTNAAGSIVSQPINITSMHVILQHTLSFQFIRSLICCIWYLPFQYSVPIVTEPSDSQTDSQTDNTAAVTGGVY